MTRHTFLLSCQYNFVYATYPGHSYLVRKKVESERSEDVLEYVEKSCISVTCLAVNGRSLEVVSTRTGNVWLKFRKLGRVLVGKQGLSLK